MLAFSWGYAGWGNHTRDLVRLVDEVEAARDFDPPLFVDVRIRRQVRAEGFRDRSFEFLLGPRYVWMPGLGNRAVVDPSLPMTLDRPGDADALLDHIVGSHAVKQRVIFFCSCASPLERHTCHRGLVTKTLVAAATRARISLGVQEWPGGAPVVRALDIAVPKGKRIPLPAALPLAEAGALPHFSIVKTGARLVVTGPVAMTAKGWALPVYSTHAAAALERVTAQVARDFTRLALDVVHDGRWRQRRSASPPPRRSRSGSRRIPRRSAPPRARR